ncbi:hypothetical protein ALC56_08037 [Trachymyrmex septentrionalis]|uniref:Uncharacterized protein n=1 Tax=Trachymyrmex septentrionalis TaxID=34720 RepID=A0A195FBQ2_9HYME|nr:hypothetical protein ALC56_08037 [Trachymyrmex septentrionalis]
MSGGAGVHRRAHTYIAFRTGNPSEREALTRIAALQCGVGRHRHGGARCVGVQCTVWRGRYMRAVCTPLSRPKARITRHFFPAC